MSKYYSVDEVESLLSCGCAYAIRELPIIETSEDCIDREWVLNEFEKSTETIYPSEYFDELIWLVKHAPNIVPKPKEGEWQITDAYPHNVYCSECHKRFAQTHWAVWEDGSLPRNYCPNCGSPMKRAEDYERATEQMEHDALYEPTYNSEDGSM